MRRFPVHCEMIRVAAVDGERRRISVSGLAKARLLWLFRNFSILDFRVLNSKQQHLVARMWQAAGSGTTAPDDPFNLIGTIDGFAPKLFPASLPVARTTSHLPHFSLPKARRAPVIWTVAAVVLLASAMVLLPRHRTTPSRATASAATRPVDVKLPPIARVSAESVVPVVHLKVAASDVSAVRPLRLPDAMALNESSSPVTPQSAPVAVKPKPRGKPEVMIRVTVDREGRASNFQIVQGDQKKSASALTATKHWHFQPCAASDECEHLLRYTDHGDASTLQVIN